MKREDITSISYILKKKEPECYCCCSNFDLRVASAFPRDAPEVVLRSSLPTHNAAHSSWNKSMHIKVFAVLEASG